MFKTIIDFFLDSKVKLVIIAIVLSSLFAYHEYDKHVAVNDAVTELREGQAREIFKLKDRANEATIALRKEFDKNQKAKNEQIKIANSKYESLYSWVHNLPASGGYLPGGSSSGTDRSEDVIGGLRRSSAESIAKLGYDAEQLKIHLVQCYKDYDSVKDTLDKFRKDNQKP